MAKNSEIYAWKLITNAAEVNQVEMVRAEMKEVLIALQEQPRFLEILKSPVMTIKTKKEWVKDTFLGQVSAVLVDFLIMLIEDEVFDYLAEIEKFYDETVSQYLEEYFNIVEGKVYSAIPLADIQLEKLETLFTEKIGKQVRLRSIVDVSLMGGYKVEVKSYVYDDTVVLQLHQLKESLRKVDLG